MKKLILLFLPIFLVGCTHDMNRREIDEINLVHVLGIDYEDNEYTLSALYNSSGGSDPEGSPGKEEVARGKGKTPYEAFEDMRLRNKKNISLAHTGYFIIGDEAARRGLDYSLDFLSRDETIKMESLIFVLKNEKASDFFDDSIEKEQFIREDLEAISQKQREMITRNDNSLVYVLNDMEQYDSSILIPYIIPEEESFLIEGYAVFDQLKLRDYLDNETSNGINFIKNIIRRYPIYLEDQVSLSVSYAETKLKSYLNNSNIRILIKVDFETAIKEVVTKDNIFQRDQLMKLTQRQNEYVRKLMEKAVGYSTATGLDILQLARLVENQHVKEWEDLRENWSESVYDIQYDFQLESKISKSFILGNER